MLGDILQGAGGEGGYDDEERTADGDKHAGRVPEVTDLFGRQQTALAAEHHTDEHDHDGAHYTDYIGNIHIFSHPF